MHIQFDSISELGSPGEKFTNLYNLYRPAYKNWIDSNKAKNQISLAEAKAALKKYMPEMTPFYNKLCKVVKADSIMAKFLTGFQPPQSISACSQAVLKGDKIQLHRNYDFHPDLLEGTLLLSSWHHKKVIVQSDCLIGALDGINEDGLAISLTFGGRKEVGKGFGIPFILRYVLEFCSTVDEAIAALKRIPSFMSYNLTIVDKNENYKTVYLSPDRIPIVTDATYTTNHQTSIDWPDNARFNQTVERSEFLRKLLAKKGLDSDSLQDAFLSKPLYNSRYRDGFGTLYTSIYEPATRSMQLRWPSISLNQSFDRFTESSIIVNYLEKEETLIS